MASAVVQIKPIPELSKVSKANMLQPPVLKPLGNLDAGQAISAPLSLAPISGSKSRAVLAPMNLDGEPSLSYNKNLVDKKLSMPHQNSSSDLQDL